MYKLTHTNSEPLPSLGSAQHGLSSFRPTWDLRCPVKTGLLLPACLQQTNTAALGWKDFCILWAEDFSKDVLPKYITGHPLVPCKLKLSYFCSELAGSDNPFTTQSCSTKPVTLFYRLALRPRGLPCTFMKAKSVCEMKRESNLKVARKRSLQHLSPSPSC